jgi:C-terminal processing protease CtpA/Prc
MRALRLGMILGIVVVCVEGGLAAPFPQSQKPKPTQKDFEEDFDLMWKEIGENYAYFDKKATDWAKVKSIHRPRTPNVKNRDDFIALLESVLEELYDAHINLNTNTSSSPRLVPTGADIWAEWRNGRAIITEIRPGYNAERAGLSAGMEILAMNGVAIDNAVDARVGKSLRTIDPAARDWALRVLLAGRHNEARRITVAAIDAPKIVAINDQPPPSEEARNARSLLEWKRIKDHPGIGYIRVNNSLGAIELVKEFDAALSRMQDAEGLILDLRNTPSGGNTTVAKGIMGRFIDRDEPYQKHVITGEELRTGVKDVWLDVVAPRGPRYAGPVVVLVDHWTGSMGEGIAIGMDAMKRAKIVGAPMAGLVGATQSVTLPNTGIGVTFPAQKLFHLNGTPRENFQPPVTVDLLSPDSRNAQDPILDAGLKTLATRLHQRSPNS